MAFCIRKRQQKNRVRWACSQRAAYTGKGAVTTSLQVKRQLRLMSQGRLFVVVADVLRLDVRQWSCTSQQSNKRWGLLLHLRQSPPIYPPRVWNLHTATLTGVEKTNNVCEGWNNSFHALVGWASAPSTVDPAGCSATGRSDAATTIVQHARGQPPTERPKHSTMQQQQRLYNLCCSRRDSTKSAIDMLHALGHCVRLQ